MYSNLAFCDVYPLSKEMKEQLYRSLTPVSTAATLASSGPDTSDSNHTYEPIETAQAMSEELRNNAPLTLIHHDGRKVTANKILSLENLRQTLMSHDKVPYDDPESRGDLYILAPMRLLTPVLEESESEMTKSKLYQSLNSVSSQAAYSDLDTSIMSIISEVLNVRSESKSYRNVLVDQKDGSRLAPIIEDSVDTCSLLHTIEEIRNNSLCNLYYSSNTDLSLPAVPQIPARNTRGYESLIHENRESRKNPRSEIQEPLMSGRLAAPPTAASKSRDESSGLPTVAEPLNESIKSVHSNTLVVTPPPTVKENREKKSTLHGRVGSRKNILNLVGSTNDILNTPKRVKIGGEMEKLVLPKENSLLSESMVSEQNEFKSLVPHLTSQGAKFLSKVKAHSGTESDLDTSSMSPRPGADFSTFSSDTPSPKLFVRNIAGSKQPRRRFSLLRQRFECIEAGGTDEDNNSDYKYGFMPEHPDAKYGFGVFTPESYNVVETAKLCNSSSLVEARSVPDIVAQHTAYSLSPLNRGDTAFKLAPDQQYGNFTRNYLSNSLHRQPVKIGDRTDATRRSMSILDDYEEKENIGPVRPAPIVQRRPPLAAVNKTSPMKILGNSIHSPQSRVYKLNPNRATLSPGSRVFGKR